MTLFYQMNSTILSLSICTGWIGGDLKLYWRENLFKGVIFGIFIRLKYLQGILLPFISTFPMKCRQIKFCY
jgi:hypothetical protein